MRALALALVVALAGCVSPAAVTPPDSAPRADAGAPVAFTACHQQHLMFPARAADFASRLPPGWRVATTDAAGETTNLFLRAHSCAEATEAWVELPVTPPEEMRAEGAHHLTLDGFTDNATLAAQYAAWGFGDLVELSDIHFEPLGSGTIARVTAERGTYEWATYLRGSSGAFGGETTTLWIGTSEGVTGRLLIVGEESVNHGFGAVSFSYSGGDAAPPIAQGIAHEVVDLSFTQHYEAFP